MQPTLQNIQSSENLFSIDSIKLSKRLFLLRLHRKQRRREHPQSPNKYRKCSRRCFDGQLRTWRRNLHQFDETNQENTNEEEEEVQTNLIPEIQQLVLTK